MVTIKVLKPHIKAKHVIEGTFSRLRQLLTTKRCLKLMKNNFYFSLKALFFFKIFKFLSRRFGRAEKRFDQKDRVDFKIYKVKTWLTINCNKILPNISRIKSNQVMKVGQLIEYNAKTIFLVKLQIKCYGKTVDRPFYKNSKLSISLHPQSKNLYSFFFFCMLR